MNNSDILFRNLIASIAHLPPPLVEGVISKLSPNNPVVTLFNETIDGPFGQVDFGCECKGIEGYVQALDTVAAGLAPTFPLPEGISDEAKAAVADERKRVLDAINNLRSGVLATPVSTDDDDGDDDDDNAVPTFAKMLGEILGVKVVVVPLGDR